MKGGLGIAQRQVTTALLKRLKLWFYAWVPWLHNVWRLWSVWFLLILNCRTLKSSSWQILCRNWSMLCQFSVFEKVAFCWNIVLSKRVFIKFSAVLMWILLIQWGEKIYWWKESTRKGWFRARSFCLVKFGDNSLISSAKSPEVLSTSKIRHLAECENLAKLCMVSLITKEIIITW